MTSMSPRLSRAALSVGLVCMALLIPVLRSPAAQAADVPFTDPAAHGYIGLCDASGQQITSGTLSDKPFVVRSVSSTPAPSGYSVAHGAKATLFAYQPIDGIAPGDWSGEALSGSAFFSNQAHPMTAGTVLDYSMGDFVGAYPTHWDHLVQLRIFYGQPNKMTYTTTYPAAVLQIDGSRWHVVQGGSVDCSNGKTKASEELALPPSTFRSASASIAASKSAAARSTGRTSGSGTGGNGTGSGATPRGGATTAAGASTPASAASSARSGASSGAAAGANGSAGPSGSPVDAAHSTSSSWSWAVILILVVGAVGAAGVARWWLTRRRLDVR
jgi:hypothetical protein